MGQDLYSIIMHINNHFNNRTGSSGSSWSPWSRRGSRAVGKTSSSPCGTAVPHGFYFPHKGSPGRDGQPGPPGLKVPLYIVLYLGEMAANERVLPSTLLGDKRMS